MKAIYICEGEEALAGPFRGSPDRLDASGRAQVLACPREVEHSYGPSGYLDWHLWAERSYEAGYRASRCDCGLFLLVETCDGGVCFT